VITLVGTSPSGEPSWPSKSAEPTPTNKVGNDQVRKAEKGIKNMKYSATELMKKLKYIQEEINSIHREDENKSYVPAEKNRDSGVARYSPLIDSDYDFMENRNRVKELHDEELKIRRVLNKFNHMTLVNGYPFTLNEGLIRLAQVKGEVTALTNMTKRGQYVHDAYNRDSVCMAVYNLDEAKEALKTAQRELSALQVAIDKTNLNSEIEYED